MQEFRQLFVRSKPLIAMLHVFDEPERAQAERIRLELEILQPHVDGVIVENYGWGYEDTLKAESYARVRMEVLTELVVQHARIPVGVNVLPNDAEAAFWICDRTGAQFIQLDHVTGEFEGCESMDQQRLIGWRRRHPAVTVLGGIHPKYYTLREPRSIRSSANSATLVADAIVVTGNHTGGEASLHDLHEVKTELVNFPIIVGSGLTSENLRSQFTLADGAIVGSFFKNGDVERPIDPLRVEELVAARNELVEEFAALRSIMRR